jgi:hypothetical protein
MFLSGAAARDHDPLRYEKALLDRWLERELAASKQRTAERS